MPESIKTFSNIRKTTAVYNLQIFLLLYDKSIQAERKSFKGRRPTWRWKLSQCWLRIVFLWLRTQLSSCAWANNSECYCKPITDNSKCYSESIADNSKCFRYHFLNFSDSMLPNTSQNVHIISITWTYSSWIYSSSCRSSSCKSTSWGGSSSSCCRRS